MLLTGPWFNINMSSYKYRKSHCGDKTILRPSYLHNWISYTGKTISLYRIGAQVPMFCLEADNKYPSACKVFTMLITHGNVAEGHSLWPKHQTNIYAAMNEMIFVGCYFAWMLSICRFHEHTILTFKMRIWLTLTQIKNFKTINVVRDQQIPSWCFINVSDI